jgi:hypothetical protein
MSWRDLIQRASEEQDGAKLMKLLSQLGEILDRREALLAQQQPPSPDRATTLTSVHTRHSNGKKCPTLGCSE